MSDVFHLAWQYLRFNRCKTFVLVASISLILFLPAGLQVLYRQAAEWLERQTRPVPCNKALPACGMTLT